MPNPGQRGSHAAEVAGKAGGAPGSAGRLRTAGLLLWVFALGFLSMGFQLVGSRLLAPSFGSTIIVWAFLISTFLAAYSAGSFLGGGLSSREPHRWRPPLAGVFIGASIGLAFVAFAGRPCLGWIERNIPGFNAGLAVACPLLFLLPVTSLSAILPFCAQTFGFWGYPSGFSTGLIYGTSTLGNIAGVLTTALVLIPRYGVRSLLCAWLVLGVVTMLLLYRYLRPHEPRTH